MAADNFFDAFAGLCEALLRDMRREKLDLFHRIEDAQAIVRGKGGVFRQSDLYRRADRIYVRHAGGFLRVEGKSGDYWGTSSPSVTVLELPAHLYIKQDGKWGVPRWSEQ